MKFYVLGICLAFMSGCSTVSSLVSYTQDNPLIVDIATRQAVIRYIDAADTPEDKLARAEDVIGVIERVQYFIEGNPTASAETLLVVIKANVDMDALSIPDRFLVEDIFTVIEGNIQQSKKEGFLDEDEVIRIRVLLRTLLNTAKVFI